MRERAVAAASDDRAPRCSCDCCNVALRRPEELIRSTALADVRVKCAPSEAGEHGPEVCDEQCTPSDDDALLHGAPQGVNTLETLRFCFYECKPPDGIASPPLAQCLALEDDEVRRVVDANGNLMDPAIVYARPASPKALALSRVGEAMRVAPAPAPAQAPAQAPDQAASPPAAAPGPAPAPAGGFPPAVGWALKGITMAKTQEREARETANRLRRIEALKADTKDTDPMAMIADISDAVASGQKAAEAAGTMARQAAEAVRSARANSWTAAIGAASAKMQALREEAHAKALKDAEATVKFPALAAAAVEKATRPYLRTVNRATQMAQQWHQKSEDDAERAQELREQAAQLRASGGKLELAGSITEGRARLQEAERDEQEAAALTASSREAYATALKASESAKEWYAVAEEVAHQTGSSLKV